MRCSILEYLKIHAKQHPDRLAVIDEFGSCTYRELLLDSQKVAGYLNPVIASRMPVAVYMEKGIHALNCFFGTAMAGGFYCLMNPELTNTRLQQILSVLSPKVILTDQTHLEAALELAGEIPCVTIESILQENLNEELLTKVEQRFLRRIDTDPLYANFTSGSTGIPKGVLVSERSVIDFIEVFTEQFGIDESDRLANQAPFDFDVSVKDIYSALYKGAVLVIVPRPLFSNPTALLDFLCDHEVTNLTWAVSALCLISILHGLDYKVPLTVKRVLFSGEVMPMKHLKNWMQSLPDAEFVNLYGPTEITCNCTYHVIDRERVYEEGIPIGKAFANEDVFLLDEENQLVGMDGVNGELCVRGSALALGYYHAPEQTAKAFVQNPLNPYYPERIYRTGDLAYYQKGELYFAGRKDFQIKYMGHRIELEEIDRAMEAIPEITRSCCIFDGEKEKLYGFYIGTMDKAELKLTLSKTLPAYMIPERLIQVEQMPLTKNGKIDRKTLLESGKRQGRRRV